MAATRSSDAFSAPGFRLGLASVVVCALSFCFALPAQAQSLGDLARQERERKAAQPAREAHVYTNDDLEQAHILVPEDQARAQATKAQARAAETADAAAGSKPAVTNSAPAGVPTIVQTIVGEKVEDVSLGEVARRYRAQRDLKESVAAQNLAQQQSAIVIAHPIQPSAPPLAYPSVGSSSSLTLTEPAQIQTTSAAAPKSADRPPAEVHQSLVNEMSEAHRLPAAPAAAVSAGNPASNEGQPQREASADARAADSAHILVHKGDTLWGMAREFLGRGKAWPMIAAANPGLKNPLALRVGSMLSVPSPFSASPEPRLARLDRGDALSPVASANLGPAVEPPCPAGATVTASLEDIHRVGVGERLIASETCASSPATRLSSALVRSVKRPG